MIQFNCIYCRQQISASEDDRGKSGKCPKCGHEFFVPKATAKDSFDNTNISEKPQQSKKHVLALPVISEGNRAKFLKNEFRRFIPTFDELSLFLMAYTLIMLFLANTPMREKICKLITYVYGNLCTYSQGPLYFLFSLISFVGAISVFLFAMGLCIYHVCTKRKKTYLEKQVMLILAIFVNLLTAVVAGIYMLINSINWTLIFPLWNLINAYLLFLALASKIVDGECVSDRNATLPQIIIGTLSVLVIFIVCNFVLDLYWAVTFSICIVYTTSFDRALQSVFPGLVYRDNKQTT
jgi:DNA-directed RNA polymerase subunit RPC12/RpoP